MIDIKEDFVYLSCFPIQEGLITLSFAYMNDPPHPSWNKNLSFIMEVGV
jgi:hypothetical protein